MELTHLDKRQNPKMVDVSAKDSTHREAIARGKITMNYEAFCAIKEQKVKKGAVLQTAIIAAIMGAKRTSELCVSKICVVCCFKSMLLKILKCKSCVVTSPVFGFKAILFLK